MTHMQGGVMNVIKGLNEFYPRTAAGYFGYIGVGYFHGLGKLRNENSNNYMTGYACTVVTLWF
jgi:hypothetical protein